MGQGREGNERHRRVTVCTCSRVGRTMDAVLVPTGLNIIINVVPVRRDSLSLSPSLCSYVRVCMWKNRHLGDARCRPPPSLSCAHFLTARRTARYGDQMRADRVSSIVYTLKKPLLLTSITIYFPSPPSTLALSLSAFPLVPFLALFLLVSLCSLSISPGLWIFR